MNEDKVLDIKEVYLNLDYIRKQWTSKPVRISYCGPTNSGICNNPYKETIYNNPYKETK